jgi:hypothetical protein
MVFKLRTKVINYTIKSEKIFVRKLKDVNLLNEFKYLEMKKQ